MGNTLEESATRKAPGRQSAPPRHLLAAARTRPPDGELIHACLAGDRKAWEALILRYERLLFAIPLRCGLSQDDAADVFQTVCVRLFENLEHLHDHDRLAGWLIRTATRESWRVRRQGQRTVALPDADPDNPDSFSAEEIPAADPLPDEIVTRLEEEHLVRQAMREIGERCSKLLGLLYYSEPPLCYAEVARRMQIPEGSIGPSRARCLQQLKRILQRIGF